MNEQKDINTMALFNLSQKQAENNAIVSTTLKAVSENLEETAQASIRTEEKVDKHCKDTEKLYKIIPRIESLLDAFDESGIWTMIKYAKKIIIGTLVAILGSACIFIIKNLIAIYRALEPVIGHYFY